MAESGVAYISIVPVAKGATKAIENQIDGLKAGTSIGARMGEGFLAQAAGVAKRAGQVISGTIAASAGVAAGVAATKGLSRLLQIEDATAKLRGLGNSAADVETIMTSALNAVRGTAFGMGEAATVAASAVAAGIRPGEELEKYLRLTGDAATIAGVSLSEMGSIINKTTTSGKVFTDNLNQLADRGIPIFQWLQEEYGVTAEGLSEMVAKGEVDSATFRKVIEENIGGAALESGNTTRGAFDNMLAALGRVGANLLGGVFPMFKTVFGGITTALEPVEVKAKELGATVATYVNPVIERMSAGFSNLLPSLSSVGSVLGPVGAIFALIATSGLGPLIKQVPLLGGFGDALSKIVSPLSIVAVALAGLIATSPPLQAALVSLGTALAAAFAPLGDAVAPALSSLMPLLNELVTGIGSLLAGALIAVTPLIAQIAPALVSIAAAALPLVTGLAQGLSAVVGFLGDNLSMTLAFTSAILGGVLAFQAYQAIMTAITTVKAAWTSAQVALNVAMTANPIGIIIVAIGALVAAIIWIATQTTFFQDVWAVMTEAIGVAWQWLYDSVIKPVADFITTVFTAIGTAVTWLWTNILQPYFTAWANVILFVWGIIQPIFNLIGSIIAIVGAAFVWLWNNAIKPAFDAIGTGFGILWNATVKPVTDWIGRAVQVLGLGVQILWTNYIQPALRAIGDGFNWVWLNVIKPVTDFIGTAVNTVGGIVGAVFGVMGSVITGAFNGVVETVRSIFNSVIDLVNGAIRGIDSVISTVGGALGIDVGISTIPRLANGGIVSRRQGGILANIGEGRYDEAVVPLGGPQLDRLRDALMDNRPTGGATRDIKVYTSDPYVAAELVSQRLASRSEF